MTTPACKRLFSPALLLTPVNVDSVSLEMLVDFARIMGSFPCMGDDPSRMETVVQILLNASALHPEQRLGHLYGEPPAACAERLLFSR